MGARLRIFLKAEEDRTLFEMRKASTVPQRVKDRAEALRLNAQGWYVEKIAHYFNWHPQTVREAIHRWEKKGLGGLWEEPGRGGKARWQAADIEYLETCLRQENRTYNRACGIIERILRGLGFSRTTKNKVKDKQVK